MKKISAVVLISVAAFAVTALAECDFPYYPEFADVI
jgi:hypothetical protein